MPEPLRQPVPYLYELLGIRHPNIHSFNISFLLFIFIYFYILIFGGEGKFLYSSAFSIGIQGLHKMKWNDKYSREILCLMCLEISPLNNKKQCDVISVALFRAVKEGFKEFVDRVLKANPYLIWARDQQWASLFQQAVLYREAEIFKLLHEHPVKNPVMILKDEFCNNVLHMAGKSTPSIRFKSIQGAVLQMQRELQWFKVISLNLLYLSGIYFDYCQN